MFGINRLDKRFRMSYDQLKTTYWLIYQVTNKNCLKLNDVSNKNEDGRGLFKIYTFYSHDYLYFIILI